MKIITQAKYINILSGFVGNESVSRYYITGICIRPHPKKGIVLVATNGHTMAVIHDENGTTDMPEAILPLNPDLLKICAKGAPKQPSGRRNTARTRARFERKKESTPGLLQWVNDILYVTNQNFDKGQENIFELKPEEITENHLYIRMARPIHGPYPEWEKVVPKMPAQDAPRTYAAIGYNTELMASFRSLEKGYHAENAAYIILPALPSEPAIVRLPSMPNFLGVIMPLRLTDDKAAEPKHTEWMQDILDASLKEHSAKKD